MSPFSTTSYEISHGGPKITVRFTSNTAELKSAPSVNLVRFCRFFNLMCEEAVEALGVFLALIAGVSALCVAVVGAFYGAAWAIHHTIWPTEKIGDIAPLIPLVIYLGGFANIVVWGLFSMLRSVWRKSAKEV
jgi:hypothetical protein